MTVKTDINKLIETDATGNVLADADQRESIDESIGAAVFVAGEETSSGIASPLTEQSRITEERRIYDEFGVWWVDIDYVAELNMTDAKGREVVFNFEVPEQQPQP